MTIGDGELHGCGGFGVLTAFDRDGEEHWVGGDAGNTKDTSGRLEVERSGKEKNMTLDREDER